ncbi:MAG: helix-turn-helix domain-containing protein [Chloroflexota bacterium]
MTETYRSSADADLVRRCQAVLLVADGMRAPKVADLLHVDQSTIHRWLDRFEAGGLAVLVTEHRDGRPVRWDEEYEHLLVETVRHDPRWHGLAQSSCPCPMDTTRSGAGAWTCPLWAGYLAQRTGITMSAERVRVLLHQYGVRLKQPTPVVHSRDPRYGPKGHGLR